MPLCNICAESIVGYRGLCDMLRQYGVYTAYLLKSISRTLFRLECSLPASLPQSTWEFLRYETSALVPVLHRGMNQYLYGLVTKTL